MENVIIDNKKAGHGLIGLPSIKAKIDGKVIVKEFSLYAGHNLIPKAVWEEVRKISVIQQYIRKGVLIEVNVEGEVKAPEQAQVNKILTLEKFFEVIAAGGDGVKPETGGHFLVTLADTVDAKQLPPGEIRSFRVKSSSEDAILSAYGLYLEKMGGAPSPKLKVRDIEKMDLDEAEEIIKDTYNPETLATWKKKFKDESLRVCVLNQIDSIEKFDGKRKEI